MLYPNGDVYRCMDKYNDRDKHLFNIMDDIWQFSEKPEECTNDRCYAACDIDWAQKFIMQPDGTQSIVEAQVKHYDSMNGSIWTSQTMEPRKHRFAHIIWAPTLVCNYSCAYCGCAVGEKKLREDFPSSYPELTTEQWLIAWDRLLEYLDYAVITMSGGEPMISSATVPVLERISHKFAIGLTTNMSKNIMELSRGMIVSGGMRETEEFGTVRVGLQQITASLHPSSKLFSDSLFKGAVLLLKNNLNCAVAINFVGYPLQLYLAMEWKAWAEANDIRFVLSPWCGTDNSGHNAVYTEAEQNYVNALAPAQRKTETQIVFSNITHAIHVGTTELTVHKGEMVRLTGTVTNKGDTDWKKGEGINILKIGGRLRIRNSSRLIGEYRGEFNAYVIAPEETLPFALEFETENLPAGSYSLFVDIVREGAFWMEDKGAIPLRVDVNIVS